MRTPSLEFLIFNKKQTIRTAKTKAAQSRSIEVSLSTNLTLLYFFSALIAT